MPSFSLDFSASLPYTGSGISLPLTFTPFWGPEMGCTGYGIEEITVEAKITDIARQYIARSICDGTAFKVDTFAVGSGGYDISYPTRAIEVNSASTELDAEIFRGTITIVEEVVVDGTSKSFVCRLAQNDISGGIGEIGLFATIIDSPYPAEVGAQFLVCLAHQPLNTKTKNHVTTYRVIVVL